MSTPNFNKPVRPNRPNIQPSSEQNTGYGYDNSVTSNQLPPQTPPPGSMPPPVISQPTTPPPGATPPGTPPPSGNGKKIAIIIGSIMGGIFLLTVIGLVVGFILWSNTSNPGDSESDVPVLDDGSDPFADTGLDAPVLPIAEESDVPAGGFTTSDITFTNGTTIQNVFGVDGPLLWGVDALGWSQYEGDQITQSSGVTAWSGTGEYAGCSMMATSLYTPMEGIAGDDREATAWYMSQTVAEMGLTDTTDLVGTWINAGYANEVYVEAFWVSGVSPEGNSVAMTGRVLEDQYYSLIWLCSSQSAADLTGAILDNNTLYPPM